MANEEQLAILKQGVEVWNKWRKELELEMQVEYLNLKGADLRGVNLFQAELHGADLSGANLSEADLNGTNLGKARLSEADLNKATLMFANLVGAELYRANFFDANLHNADLREANLKEADLGYADLSGANFRKADLREAKVEHANLSRTNLSNANLLGSRFLQSKMGDTILGTSDLSEIIGLEDVAHTRPSSISTDAFALSKGKIPEIFLRGCGLSDWEVEEVKLYNPDLGNDEINKILYKIYDLRASQALQISPLFISYSHANGEFVNKIGDNLTKKGIRYWRDIHDMKSGRIEKQIDRAISQNPTVLLVLSENSLSSDWVEHEVRTARELEKEMVRDVLCPVAMDDSWKNSRWEKRIMEQIMKYQIVDFSAWENNINFEIAFKKLIGGLDLFYKG